MSDQTPVDSAGQNADRGYPPAPRFYSVTATARILGVSPMTLYREIDDGHFPAIRIRNRLVIPAKAIEDMVDAAILTRSVVHASDWADRPAR